MNASANSTSTLTSCYVIAMCVYVLCIIGCQGCKCNNGRTNLRLMTEGDANKDKVWLFAVDGIRKPYNFLDDNGKLIGFDVDLVNKVCKTARKKCDVVLAEFDECTTTERDINYAGRGLMSGWFDACTGYVKSEDRLAAFDFTEPYKATDATFTVKRGNPKKFNPDADDFSQFTLGHLNGAVTNAKCLERLGKKFGKILLADNLPDAKALLDSGKVDVLFSARHQIPDLEVLPQRFHCDIGGTAVVAKKGSELACWWDKAFKHLVHSGEFEDLCSKSQRKYNTTLNCLTKKSPDYQSLGRWSSLFTQTMNQDGCEHEKVWLFTNSGHRKPYAYLDEQGKLKGWNVDLVMAVCAEAKMRCEYVLTPFTDCSFTERNINYGGRGLMGGWFDGCVGYADAMDRANAVDFTDAFLSTETRFAVLPGNPSGFDPAKHDLSKFTLTHLSGAYTNAQCLNRLKKKVGKIIISANLPVAKKLLMDKKADVILSPRSYIPDLEVLPNVAQCAQTGLTVMVKKGSSLPDWWNPAFMRLVKKGLYRKLCHDGSVKYNRTIECLPEASIMLSRPIDEIIG